MWIKDNLELPVLVVAIILLLACLVRPTLPMHQPVFRYIFVLDITQSMNTRDYLQKRLPPDRFSFAKTAIQQSIRELPCGSEAAVGIFSTKDVLLLFEPIEVCDHFAAIEDSIAHIDWRMAWAADSNIERGLYSAILLIENMDLPTRLVFLTDGEQTIQELHRPPLAAHSEKVEGFIFGVGGLVPTPIPKIDHKNRLIGYWKQNEVNRFSLTKGDIEESADAEFDAEQNYLSSLREPELQFLASITGLVYQRLESPAQFSKALQTEKFAEFRTAETDIRGVLAVLSLGLILSLYLSRTVTSWIR